MPKPQTAVAPNPNRQRQPKAVLSVPTAYHQKLLAWCHEQQATPSECLKAAMEIYMKRRAEAGDAIAAELVEHSRNIELRPCWAHLVLEG